VIKSGECTYRVGKKLDCFYLRDVQYLSSLCVCLSVCHKSVFY